MLRRRHIAPSYWREVYTFTCVMKYEESLQYGGPEEGGWNYNSGTPEWRIGIPLPKALAYPLCRFLNNRERKRQVKHEKYGYTSVLAYRSTHYTYGFSDTFIGKPYPEVRPYYE